MGYIQEADHAQRTGASQAGEQGPEEGGAAAAVAAAEQAFRGKGSQGLVSQRGRRRRGGKAWLECGVGVGMERDRQRGRERRGVPPGASDVCGK